MHVETFPKNFPYQYSALHHTWELGPVMMSREGYSFFSSLRIVLCIESLGRNLLNFAESNTFQCICLGTALPPLLLLFQVK